MTNIKIVEHVVQELPSERPLVVGHKYKVIQADGTLIEYVINSQGEPVRLKGITNDESSRLDRLSSEQISKVESITTGDISKLKDLDSQGEADSKLNSKVDKESGKSLVEDGLIEKLEEDYTKEQIDDKISDLGNLATSSKISLGDSTVLPVPPQSGGVTIPNAWVELSQNVTYTQSGGSPITGIDGHRSIAEWDNDNEVWSLVDMGEMPVGSLKEWVAGSYLQGDVRTYKNKVYRAKVNTTATPTGFDWQEIGGHTDAVIDQNATINFNGTTHELEVVGTLVIMSGNNRYRVNDPVNLALVQDEPAVLYVIPDSSSTGNIGTIATQDIGGIPSDAIVFASYSRTTADRYSVNGLDNYSINGIGQSQNNFFGGNLLSTNRGFNFDTVNNTISVSGTKLAVYLNKRVLVAPQSQTIPLESTGIYVLYVTQEGVLDYIEQSNIVNIPFGSVKIGGYLRYGVADLHVSGIDNYSINGIVQTKSNYFFGNRQGSEGAFNFDLVNKQIKITSTNIFFYEDKRIISSPQSQNVQLPVSGTHVIYVTQGGELGTAEQSNLNALPFGAVVFGTYRTFSNSEGDIVTLNVSGIDNYSINGIPSKYAKTSVGKLVTQGRRIDIQEGQTMVISGGAMLIIGSNRYIIPDQSVSFSSSPSVFYFVPSTGVIGTSQSSSINMPPDAIIFGGHYGAVGGRFEFWGVDNYNVRGFNRIFWEKKLVQKKLLTDFNPIDYYYSCDTTLSMTSSDPEPLIGSDPNIMKNRYEVLMAQYPTLFEKEEIANIPTSMGMRSIDVFTFTPPSVSTEPRSDSGVVVVEQPHIFINCSIHGSEKTASIACYQFLEDILTKWQENKVLEWFRFNVKLSIIPVANPAGWVNGTRGNGNLVDLNRNFPFRYISNYNPGQTTWSGNEALDQPESLAINTWMEENKNNLLLVIDFHNFFGTSEGLPNLLWTEGVSQYTNQLGRVASQRVSRGSRESSEFFPEDVNDMLGTSSYVTNPIGRLSGQANNICPYGLTFEISQNFRFDPNFEPNDNSAIRLGTEAFGNSLTQFVWHCMQDYNSKESVYDTL